MKAVIHTRYGHQKYLKLEEVDRPIPKKDELLVRIYASTVTPSDVQLRTGKFPLLFWLPVRLLFGLFRPRRKILGYEMSGIIIETGEAVSKFEIGQEIIAATYRKMSTHSEYICINENSAIILKPNTLNIHEAAALPDGSQTALHFLKIGGIEDQDVSKNILVYGASGSVGSYAIQIAKAFGAQVTAVCRRSNFEVVKSLGADEVIDYRNEDYGTRLATYDIVFDTVGKSSFKQAKPALKENGVFLTTKAKLSEYLKYKVSFHKVKQFKTSISVGNSEKLRIISKLVEEGKVKPFIDRTYYLHDIGQAHEYVETGRKRGNVVIIIHDLEE